MYYWENRACGHVAALLYMLADLKMRKKVTLQDYMACTSKAQSGHKPRGEKIKVRRYSP